MHKFRGQNRLGTISYAEKKMKQMKVGFFFKSELELFVLQVPLCPQSKAKCVAKIWFLVHVRHSILHTAKPPWAHCLSLVIPHIISSPVDFFSIHTFSLFLLLSCISHLMAELAPPGFSKSLCLIKQLSPFSTQSPSYPNTKSSAWLVREGGKFVRNKRLRLPAWWDFT